MNGYLRSTLTAMSLAVGLATFSATANAACFDTQSMEPSFQKEAWHGDAQLMRIDWRERHQDDIVGYWNIVSTSKGNMPAIPDGAIIDRGLQQWHDDGTEMLNSSFQSPQTQNYCLGVWEKVGPSHYLLNHFAYSYDVAQNITGLVRIREDITVADDGNRFSGKATIDIYDKLRNHMQQVKSTIVGKRITVDTTALEVL